jgi:bifunctional enzyme CysN/CysC
MASDVTTADLDRGDKALEGDVTTRPALRILTCGSVDSGMSTLIGRLLYEKAPVFDDQPAAIERDSRKFETVGDEVKFALLPDGLEAELEQCITIDVGYRYFATDKRSFIVTDALGHEQYARNVAIGASNSDVAVIVVDASKGLLPQTLRHSIIVSLLGIRHVVLAVNKIDLVRFDQSEFEKIVGEFRNFAASLSFSSLTAVPISARYGDNVASPSDRIPWFRGRHLLSVLEDIDVDDGRLGKPFRMAVQWVNRPDHDFRGFSGRIASGSVRPGDSVIVAGSSRLTRVERIVTADGDLAEARAGDAITLVLADEIDVARGDVLSAANERPEVADQFAAHLIWLNEDRLLPGRSYLLKIGARTVPATVTEIKHRLDINTLDKLAAKTLAMNEVGFCNLATSVAVAFDSYAENRETGAFILIDRYSNATVAAGMVAFGLRRATNVHYQDLTVSKQARSQLKQQRPVIIWFTGLSGAGKSTVANLVEAQLLARGVHTIMLDGDNVRHGLSKDLGFTDADRVENIRRIGEVAKLMTEAGLIVLCSLISPFRSDRQMVRNLVDQGEFLEVFVDTPIEVCIARDPKGLYKRALAGEIKNFTGVDQAYEPPENPEIRLMAAIDGPEVLAQRVIEELLARRLF